VLKHSGEGWFKVIPYWNSTVPKALPPELLPPALWFASCWDIVVESGSRSSRSPPNKISSHFRLSCYHLQHFICHVCRTLTDGVCSSNSLWGDLCIVALLLTELIGCGVALLKYAAARQNGGTCPIRRRNRMGSNSYYNYAPSLPLDYFVTSSPEFMWRIYIGTYRYIRCIYGIFGREITIHTVIYGVFLRLWPTLWIML